MKALGFTEHVAAGAALRPALALNWGSATVAEGLESVDEVFGDPVFVGVLVKRARVVAVVLVRARDVVCGRRIHLMHRV